MVCIEASLIPLPLNPRYGNFSNTICRPKIYRFVSLKCSQQTIQQETQKDSIFTEDETELINALIGIQGRGRSASPQQIKAIDRAVQKLELVKGVTDPTSSSLIDGRWQLMFTTRPGTASPIQRTFVGVNSFTVFQDVCLRNMESRISNIVKFSEAIGELKVEAEALIKDGKRIIFQFDRAAFSFKFLPFKVPYPVPFRLLGDEAKGWLDTTYMSKSGNIRISRGNKGTTFVLQKETEPRQKLLSAIATGRDVREVVEEFFETSSTSEVELGEGEWLMLWSTQEVTESWLENASKGLMGKQIIRPDGDIKFVVDILFGFKFSMTGKYVKCGSNTYEVTMDDAAIIAGSYGIPQEMTTKFNIQLIYNDGKIRISRGYNNILFVYIRIDDE